MQHFSEAFRKRLCRFTHHLTGEDVTNGVHHDFGFLVPIVTHQLTEILKAQAYRNFVASCRCNKIIQTLEIDGRQLVNDNRGLEHPFLVDELYDAGIIQTECSTVDVLTVGVVAHT